ncbi:MAG: endonuclease/exonuclease/phosphatase family protein [Candidatus Binatia bacterium]
MKPIELKAVTFNVFHDYPRCRHVEPRLAILEDALAAEAPDVVILQEASASLLYGHLVERLVSRLRSRGLGYDFHYAAANGSLARGEAFEEGSAILSRAPIRDAAVRRLAEDHPVEREYQGYRFVEYRIALAATIAFREGVELEVVGAHVTDATSPPGEPSARRRQVEDLATFVAARSAGRRPAVVGGDFNAVPESPEIGWLRARGLLDVCAAAEPGPTNDPDDRDLESPRDTARHRIDHLFVLPGPARFEVRATRLFLASPVEVEPGRRLWASDHNGVLAELAMFH